MGYLSSNGPGDLERRLVLEKNPKQSTNLAASQHFKNIMRLSSSGVLLALCFLLGFFVRKHGIAVNPISPVDADRHEDGTFSFSLPVEEEWSSLNVLVVGDWGRGGLYNQSVVAEQMARVSLEVGVEFIISVGDNFYEDGLTGVDDPQFNQSFSQIYLAESLQKTWYSVLGNHDYRGDALAQLDPALTLLDPRWHCRRSFSLLQPLPPSSSSSENESYVEFFFYDTTPFVEKYWNDTEHIHDWRGVEPKLDFLNNQKKFLSNGLASSNAMWKVVIGHHPIRSVGVHGNTLELEEHIYPILQEFNVDLYVNGHDHCLEHITQSGIHFVTSGGGSKAWRGMDKCADQNGLQFYYDGQGFVSLSFNSSALSFAFYDALGNVLHNAFLTK